MVAELTDDPAKKNDLAVKGAKVLFDAGQTDAAIAAYQKLLAADAGNAEGWYWLGMAYANAAKFKESADALQTFVEKAPNDPRAAEAKTVIAELVKGNNLPPPKSLDDGKKKSAPAKKKP